MSLLSVGIVVADDSEVEECFSSQAQPVREASANPARQVKSKIGAVLVIFINLRLRREPTHPMGCTPHDVSGAFGFENQTLKAYSKKRSKKVGSG
jgi:hypothetical protein